MSTPPLPKLPAKQRHVPWSDAWRAAIGDSKTSKWHLDKLKAEKITKPVLEKWIKEGADRTPNYHSARLFLAASIARATKGMRHTVYENFHRRANGVTGREIAAKRGAA